MHHNRASHGLPYEKRADGKGKAECIEDEIPFDLPEGWSWARVASISDEPSYGTSKKSDREGAMPVLRMGNITRVGKIDYSDLVYTSDANDIAKYALHPGDLIFNRTNSREWVGKVAYYDGSIPAIYAGYLVRFRVILINPRYINYAMCTQYERNWCTRVKTDGVNQSNINAKKLKSFLIPVPPLAEQRRIVDALDKYLALVDEVERDQADLGGLFAQLRSKVLDLAVRGELTERDPEDEPASELLARIHEDKLAMVERGELKPKDVKNDTVIFTGSDGLRYEKPADGKGEAKCIEGEIPFEIPEGWSWARLGQIVATCGGKTPSKANKVFWEGGGVPWITSKDMKAPELFSSQIELTESGAAETNMVPAGSVLMVVRSGILRRLLPVAINRVKTTINQDLKAMTPYDLRLSDWLITCFNAWDKRIRDIYHKDGTTVDSIEFDAMLTMLLPVPPLTEQRRIVEAIKTTFNLTNL